MRKLFALLFVAAAFTFVACENKGGETGSADTAATADTAAAVDPMPQPTADTAAVTADTAAVDTAAAE